MTYRLSLFQPMISAMGSSTTNAVRPSRILISHHVSQARCSTSQLWSCVCSRARLSVLDAITRYYLNNTMSCYANPATSSIISFMYVARSGSTAQKRKSKFTWITSIPIGDTEILDHHWTLPCASSKVYPKWGGCVMHCWGKIRSHRWYHRWGCPPWSWPAVQRRKYGAETKHS